MNDTQKPDTAGVTAAFRLGAREVDPLGCRIRTGDAEVKLPPQVMDVLIYLAAHPMQVVSRDEIEAIVWDGRTVGYDSLTGTIFKLRKALGDDPRHPKVIETVPKRGYRLLMEPELLTEAPKQTHQSTGDRQGPDETIEDDAASGRSASERRTTRFAISPFKRWGSVTVRGDFNVWALLGAAFLVLAMAATWHSMRPITPSGEEEQRARNSIVVLPFATVGNAGKSDYFADGLTDDLTTMLAKQRDLLVIARHSAFFYKDQNVSDDEISARLNVRYVLRGSVQQQDHGLRINARLTDIPSGRHVWAEHFDGQPTNLFALQDEIVGKIVNSLTNRIAPSPGQKELVARTKSLEAYDAFLAGRQHFYLYLNKRENEKARALFQQALEYDPDFALAHIMLAFTYAFDAMNGWSDDREASLDRALAVAGRGISLDKTIPLSYFIRGLVFRERKEYVKALVEAEKAIALDPNYANGHVLVASLLFYAGRPEESIAGIEKAMRLNPHHPFNYAFHLGQAYFALSRYSEAIGAFKDGIATNPAAERLHVWLAASYAQAGQIEDAKWEAEQIRALNPEFKLPALSEAFPFKDRAIKERFLEGLRGAGLS